VVNIRRVTVLSAAVVLLSTGLTLGLSAAASAKTPPFTGNATGSVTCSVSAKIKFPGGLRLNSGPSEGPIKASFGDCTVSGSSVPETIVKGKGSGSFSGTSGGCAALASPSTTDATVLSMSVKWKGTYNGGKAKYADSSVTIHGATTGTDASGNITFTVPSTDDITGGNGGNVSGSFTASNITQQSTLDTGESSSTFANECGGKHGIKKLSVTGTITIP
jgi:hypothetical protein